MQNRARRGLLPRPIPAGNLGAAIQGQRQKIASGSALGCRCLHLCGEETSLRNRFEGSGQGALQAAAAASRIVRKPRSSKQGTSLGVGAVILASAAAESLPLFRDGRSRGTLPSMKGQHQALSMVRRLRHPAASSCCTDTRRPLKRQADSRRASGGPWRYLPESQFETIWTTASPRSRGMLGTAGSWCFGRTVDMAAPARLREGSSARSSPAGSARQANGSTPRRGSHRPAAGGRSPGKKQERSCADYRNIDLRSCARWGADPLPRTVRLDSFSEELCPNRCARQPAARMKRGYVCSRLLNRIWA